MESSGYNNNWEAKHEAYFEKQYSFKKEINWKLPLVEELFPRDTQYQFDALQTLKTELNQVKSKLNCKDIEKWSSHTRRRNPAGEIASKLRREIKAEFITQAWCKFFECLNQYQLVKGPELNSVHLCEAPGAFIAALNHFLHSKYSDVKWKWLASTLNPYYEGNSDGCMIADDRFILHTLNKWVFGTDFTGNITNYENIEEIYNRVRFVLSGQVHLITADGSIDCMDSPDTQEEDVCSLHYAEICAAFKMLSDGGCFVIKMFTLFDSKSVSLMYLLNCVFEEVHVFKPVTSKCGNSEVYVICINFQKSILNDYIEKLFQNLQSNSIIFDKKHIPEIFLKQHEECVKFFMKYQIDTINSNIDTFDNKTFFDYIHCAILRSDISNLFFRKFNIRAIDDDKKIVNYLKTYDSKELNRRFRVGSHQERLMFNNLPNDEKIMLIHYEFKKVYESFLWEKTCTSMISKLIVFKKLLERQHALKKEKNSCNIRLYYGKKVKILKSSSFLSPKLMDLCKRFHEADTDLWNWNNEKIRYVFKILVNEKYIHKNYSSHMNFILNEREFFDEVIQRILLIGTVLELHLYNVPLLTHCSVSMIFYFANYIFKSFDICENSEIIFKFLQKNALNNLTNLLKILKKENSKPINGDDCEENENTLLCFVDIKNLHEDSFKKIITCYNDNIIARHCNARFIDFEKKREEQ